MRFDNHTREPSAVGTSNDGRAKPDLESALLEEGAESYIQAVSAILSFRALVQSRCRQVVQKRSREYGAARLTHWRETGNTAHPEAGS